MKPRRVSNLNREGSYKKLIYWKWSLFIGVQYQYHIFFLHPCPTADIFSILVMVVIDFNPELLEVVIDYYPD